MLPVFHELLMLDGRLKASILDPLVSSTCAASATHDWHLQLMASGGVRATATFN